MIHKIKDKIYKKIEWLTGIIGIATFIAVYGIKVINPTWIDFISIGGDVKGHYLGWCWFRNSPWQFPLGMIEGCIYPYPVSVIYTDSIPLFAILFKILSPILPNTFQYFGIWGVFSFFMTGLISGCILKMYLDSPYLICVSSIFMILNPVCLRRMFGHTALAGIWILLLGIYILIRDFKYDKKGCILQWSAIATLCAGIHIYYLAILGIILAGYCLWDICTAKKIRSSLKMIITYFASALLALWCLGAFNLGGASISASGGGLGHYSANLNALFNPIGEWSKFMPELPVYTNGQYEGFAYIGAGMIVLLALSILFLICFVWTNGKKGIIGFKNKKVFSLFCIILVSVFIALSPVASFNGIMLYELKIPDFLEHIWSIFRSTGRFIWIFMFLTMIFSLCSFASYRKKIWYKILITFCLLLQLYDLSEKTNMMHRVYTADRKWENSFEDNVLKDVVDSNDNYSHLVIASKNIYFDSIIFDISRFALENKLTTNTFYVSRVSRDWLYEQAQKAMQEKLESDTIYIFEEDDPTKNNFNLCYYKFGEKYEVGVVNNVNLNDS